jgi:hypothetical protein
MQLIPILKKYLKSLENETIPAINISFRKRDPELRELFEDFLLYFPQKIGIVYSKDNQQVQNQKISAKLGFSPQYYANRGSENYRNGIWGFELQDEDCKSYFIIYNSKKGMQLDCRYDVDIICLKKLLRALNE